MCGNQLEQFTIGTVVKWANVALAVLMFLIGGTTQVRAQPLCEMAPSESLVKILPNRADVEGSGIVLTPDGFIITARHVIEGYLEVFVRLHNDDGEKFATIVAADEYLDVAILKVDVGPASRLTPALALTAEGRAQMNGGPLCVGGFGLTKTVDSQTGAVRIQVDPLTFNSMSIRNQLYGYTFVEGQIKSGFSGGGAFVGDRLFGINLERGKFGSRILPFHKIQSFLKRNGFDISPDGKVEFEMDLESVAQQVRNNRGNIQRILTDVRWKAKHEGQQVILSYSKILPTQNVAGFFTGSATPIFDNPGFNQWLLEHEEPLKFTVNGKVADGRIVFRDIEDELQGLLIKYEDDFAIEIALQETRELRIYGYVRVIPTKYRIGPISLTVKFDWGSQ